MSDEQTIYISPEDDLTTVRERLEHVQSRQVTLVIPSQTQLRSHVAWKLLYARTRELGKDVLIVSSDPQVRSVAHAVKFTVAHSLEAASQGHARPVSRPTRNSVPTRNKSTSAASPRTANTRGGTRNTNGLRSRNPEARPWSNTPGEFESMPSSMGNSASYRDNDPEIEDVSDEASARPSQNTERRSDKRIGPRSDVRFGAPSSIRPLSQEQIEEEPDLLLEDYTIAQDIRQAVSRPEVGQNSAPPMTPASLDEDDDFLQNQSPAVHNEPEEAYPFEEDQPAPGRSVPPLREQRGNVRIEDTNAEVPDPADNRQISDMPTSIVGPHMHYIDEEDDAQTPLPEAPPPGLSRRVGRQQRPLDANDEAEIETGRNAPEKRAPRTHPRTGYMAPGKSSSQHLQQEGLEDDDFLPIEDRPTHYESDAAEDHPVRTFESGTLAYDPPTRTPSREPSPVQLPARPGASQAAAHQMVTPRPGPQRATANRVPGTPRPAGPQRPTQQRPSRQLAERPPRAQRTRKRSGHGLLIAVVTIIGLIGIILLLSAIPSNTITLTVAARNYTHAVTLSASTNGQPDTATAQLLTQTFTKQGPEQATGTKTISTAQAQGTICFNNNGATGVEVPTGTIVEAAGDNNVQFATKADAKFLAHTTCANNPLPDPIQAVNPGESGNVPAGAITVIPDNSLTQIAQYNNTTADQLKLSVINTDNISGGGTSPVAAVTDADLTHAKQDLHQQLQIQINAWLKSQLQDGVLGKLATTDTLINTPAAGTTLNTGNTFQATVKVIASALFVSNTNMKTAILPQLANSLQTDKKYAGYILLSGSQQPAITMNNLKIQNSSTTSLKASFNATARAINDVYASGTDQIKNLAAGKTPADATSSIKAKFTSIHAVNVSTSPDIFAGIDPWITFWQSHINVKIVPDATANSK